MLPTRQFQGNQFWRELIFGEGREGGVLTACGFLSREHTGFPGNREVQPTKFCQETKAWSGMFPAIIYGQGLTILLKGQLVGRVAKKSALQRCGHQSPSVHPAFVQAAIHPQITAF